MEAFIAQKRNAQQKLSALGVPFHDRLLALLLLQSMPDSFAAAKSTLTHLHRDTFTFESVADALVSELTLRQAATAASSEHGESAIYAANNRGKKTNPAAAKSADRNKCTKEHCSGRGHSKDSCWARIGYPVTHRLYKAPGGADQQQQQRPNTGHAKQAYVANDNFDSDDESVRFISEARLHTTDEVAMYLSTPPSDNTSIWCVDSGASHHYCNDRALFRNLEPVADKSVSVANGATSDIIGCGTIDTDFPILPSHPRVRCVPALCCNLLSVSEMSKRGWRVDFQGDVCNILSQDGKTTIATAVRSGGIYRAHVKGRNAALTSAAEIANAAADKATADRATNNTAVLSTPPPVSEEAMLWHECDGAVSVGVC